MHWELKYISWLVLISFGIGVNIDTPHDMRAIKISELLVLVGQSKKDIVSNVTEV